MQLPFPAISEIPALLDATNWSWKRPSSHNRRIGIKSEWWIGVDEEGVEWLVKMRGSDKASREHTFSTLAQRLGISCQSSSYLLIPSPQAPPRLHTPHAEECQLALCLINEHAPTPCSSDCPLSSVFGKGLADEVIRSAELRGGFNHQDLVKASVLGFLCGQFEQSEFILSRSHQYVVIDNEFMFSGGPCLLDYGWFQSPHRQAIALQVCQMVLEIPDEDLAMIATPPLPYKVSSNKDLEVHLLAAKAEAERYVNKYNHT